MADISVTPSKVGVVDPSKSDLRDYIAAESIWQGATVYLNTSGQAALADADAGSNAEEYRGVATTYGSSGQAVTVCHAGEIYGYDLSSLTPGVLTYLSDNAGFHATVESTTVGVATGRVVVRPDKDATKVLRVFTQWEADWSTG